MSSPTVAGEGPGITATQPQFQQRLGLFDSTMLVAGSMIGSGIYIVSHDIAQDVGGSGWLLLVWALTGLMTVIGALSYGELAAMMPHAGGQYVYLRQAYSPLWGFLYGWTFFLVIQTGTIAAVGVAFSKFLGVLVPALGTRKDAGAWMLYEVKGFDIALELPLPWMAKPLTVFHRTSFSVSAGQIVALAVIWFLTLLNCRGVQEGKIVQNVFTVVKTLTLIGLILLGVTVAYNAIAAEQNFAAPWDGVADTARTKEVVELVPGLALLVPFMVCGGAMVGSLFSSDAWNNVTFTAGEVRNPRRNLPLSLAFGTILVIALYLLANVAYLVALPIHGKAEATTAFERGIDHAQDDRVATALMEQVVAGDGPKLMAVAIMISTFGCMNGLILSGARLYYAMARDGLFFSGVGQLNDRGVPAAGLLLQGVWASLLVFSGSYGELLDYVIFAALLFYALTVLGLFVLRRRQPDTERPYRAFGYPVIPGMYVLLCTAVMLDLLVVKPVYTWPGLIIVLTGIPVYFLWRAFGSRPVPNP